MSFAMDVSSFNAITHKQFDQIRRKGALELFTRVVNRTPVDTGFHRGAWQTTVASPATTGVDRSPGSATQEVMRVVGSSGMTESLYLANMGPAIRVLEYGGYPNPPKGGKGKTEGGFSRQAPNGMVRVSVAEFPYIVSESSKGTKFNG